MQPQASAAHPAQASPRCSLRATRVFRLTFQPSARNHAETSATRQGGIRPRQARPLDADESRQYAQSAPGREKRLMAGDLVTLSQQRRQVSTRVSFDGPRASEIV